MLATLLQVAAGGAAGSVLRWSLGLAIMRGTAPGGFPVAIIAVNVLGSAAMGAFVALAARHGLAHLSPFVMTGLLGGFTTFSAFSLETVTLLERGQAGQAALYVALSVVLSVGGLALGVAATRLGA